MPVHDPNTIHNAAKFLPAVLGGHLSLSEIRKAIVPVAGFAAQLVALGLVPAAELPYVSGALWLLAAFGVYKVKNATPPASDAPAPVADAPAPPAV